MESTYVATLLLMVLSGGLMDWHRRTLRAADHESDREQRFARWQYVRRMTASATIGILGIALAFYPIVPQRPWPMTLYVAFLMLSCLWMIMMAFADAWATRAHWLRQRRDDLATQLKGVLEAKRRSDAARKHSEEATPETTMTETTTPDDADAR